MKYLTSKMKQQELEWRRNKVLELSSQGYSEREISETLKVNDTAVHRDLAYIRKQSQQNLEKHIHDVVPEEYQKCMMGMKRNLKQTLEIAETAADPKIKLQARAIATDCYKYIMDLCTNAGIISDAMKYVAQKTEQLNTLSKLDEKIEETEYERTTDGVF
jgi:hypothetical protein